MVKSILALAGMEKLLKKAGSERVSDTAKEALREALEEYAQHIGEKAFKFARHSGRKTVKAEDIKLAVKS
jgi:DNA-binding protein